VIVASYPDENLIFIRPERCLDPPGPNENSWDYDRLMNYGAGGALEGV
jgi:hypothetical protein